jgi:hypothetical protein
MMLGRPPITGARVRMCEGIRSLYTDGEIHNWECSAKAMWLVPEAGFCAHHMPIEWLAIVRERAQQWAELGAFVWDAICTENPLPDGALELIAALELEVDE